MLGAAANYSRGLATQFGLEEQEGVPTIAPELMPVSDIHMRPEQWGLHGGTLLIANVNIIAGGAGNRSQAAVEPGVGELVIVERIILQGATAQTVQIFFSRTPLTSLGSTMIARDTRKFSDPTSTGRAASGTKIRFQSNTDITNAGDNLVIHSRAALALSIIPLDVVLVTPWSLRIAPNNNNETLEPTTFIVRARPATPRELAIGAI